MAEICFDGIELSPPWFDFDRHATKCKGSPLGTIAGLAISIAVPFVAPAIAGAIFGSSIMAGLGGILATAGTGAVLGGIGAAVTGGDWMQGALFGGLGAGAVQGLGLLGSTANPIFGGAGAGAQAAGIAAAGTPGAAAPAGLAAGTQAAAGLAPSAAAGTAAGLGAAGAAGTAAPTGLAAFGANLPWDKLGNAAMAAAPQLLGAAVSELSPPSEAALAAEQMAQQDMQQQQEVYSMAMNNARNINPEYFAQDAANAARLRVATAAAEGARTPGLYDPARYASDNRKNAVAGVQAAGTAYNDSYLTALQAQYGATYTAAGLRPNNAAYSEYLASYGVDAEREKRAEEMSKFLTPFSQAFAKSTNTSQVT